MCEVFIRDAPVFTSRVLSPDNPATARLVLIAMFFLLILPDSTLVSRNTDHVVQSVPRTVREMPPSYHSLRRCELTGRSLIGLLHTTATMVLRSSSLFGCPMPMIPGKGRRTVHSDSGQRHSASPRRCARSTRASSRRLGRAPPLKALRAQRALPAADFGPVAFFQGRHCRISFACCARRSGVQPFAIALLQ